MCDWMAAATSYSTHGVPMIPFYIFYSMFGFQRVGDLAWAAGDMRSRGFLLGGTAGRTTLNGEGLQHEDGHSHLYAATIPNCISYDPTFRLRGGRHHPGWNAPHVRRAAGRLLLPDADERELHPPGDAGRRGAGHHQGNVPAQGRRRRSRSRFAFSCWERSRSCAKRSPRRSSWRRTGASNRICWSCPSFTELARDGNTVSRWNMMNPTAKPKVSHVESCLADTQGPVIATSDYIRAFAEQIRAFVPRRYVVLGTDGFGRSDTREKLRQFFEVDRHYIAVAALKALADDGEIPAAKVAEADEKVWCRWRQAGARGRCERRLSKALTDPQTSRLSPRYIMPQTVEVKVPDIGDFTDVPVIEVLVKAGDSVKAEDSLVTLESGQGNDGRALAFRGCGQGREGQARRQGQRGKRHRNARGRGG